MQPNVVKKLCILQKLRGYNIQTKEKNQNITCISIARRRHCALPVHWQEVCPLILAQPQTGSCPWKREVIIAQELPRQQHVEAHLTRS